MIIFVIGVIGCVGCYVVDQFVQCGVVVWVFICDFVKVIFFFGVEVVKGDLFDFDVLCVVFDGVSILFLFNVVIGDEFIQVFFMFNVVCEVGVKWVVYLLVIYVDCYVNVLYFVVKFGVECMLQ